MPGKAWDLWLKKALLLIPTTLGTVTLVFLVLRLTPGDPVLIMLGEHATGEDYERLVHALGLDKPIYVQYSVYLTRIFHGDWGRSISTRESVLPYVLRRFGATLELTVAAITLASGIGISLGTLAGLKKGTILDRLCTLLSLSFFSVPVFWVGLILMLIFALYLDILPALGRNVVLPAMTLAIWASGVIARVTRASVLDVMDQDFVVTARAKGVSHRRLLFNHVLRNAFVPIITTIGLQIGLFLGGTVITETVFNFPGIGSLIVDGIFRRDFPVVQGGVLLVSIFIPIVNFVIDVLYSFLDPRISFR